MFPVITNIYNKKTKGPTLIELFTATEKLLQWSAPKGLKARIIAAVKNIDAPMLTRVWQELEYRIEVCVVSPVVHTSNASHCQKFFFSFPVTVNNSIKVSPLAFLL
jgi:hypothetical protein